MGAVAQDQFTKFRVSGLGGGMGAGALYNEKSLLIGQAEQAWRGRFQRDKVDPAALQAAQQVTGALSILGGCDHDRQRQVRSDGNRRKRQPVQSDSPLLIA